MRVQQLALLEVVSRIHIGGFFFKRKDTTMREFELAEDEYRVACRPMRTPHKLPRKYSPRYERRPASPALRLNGPHRRRLKRSW